MRDTASILITGGAGFVGANLADHFLCDGYRVRILDNLSRSGSERNLEWLRRRHGRKLQVHAGDLRDAAAIARAVEDVDEVYHFAAQVAVTTSLQDPLADLAVNGMGTLHLLEAIRHRHTPPALVFTSTNKVYGALGDIDFERIDQRYQPLDPQLRAHGVSEERPLDLHSPYGCSKGVADQYVLDYARSFGLPTVVLRMSCIYGPQQHGTTDQGWVAHFARAARQREPITIYGDGCQVRDLLYVGDLVQALRQAGANAQRLAGQAFNMGGGPRRAVSLMQVAQVLADQGTPLDLDFADWRVGDQRWYVADTRRFQAATGWEPEIGVAEGIARLVQWLEASDRASGRQPTTHGAATAAVK
jgi:CDP-paratose 2-epimerase